MGKRWIGLALAFATALPGSPATHAQGKPRSQGAPTNPIRVGILLYEGVYNTEFIAPLDVLQHAQAHTQGRLEVFTVSPQAGPITSAEGLRFSAQFQFANAPRIDWLIVPSGREYKKDMQDAQLVGWIQRVGSRAQVVHSNCWGSFLLGAAGLLDGKQATTFPQTLDEFARAFPRMQLRREMLVDDQGAVTSAGGVVSYDAALYLLEKHFGIETARAVAAGLVINWDKQRAAYRELLPPPAAQ